MRINRRILPLLILLADVYSVLCDQSFISEPSEQPYYVREGEPGPLLNCAFSDNYRNRSRYEPQWTRVVSGVPKLLTRDSNVFQKNDYLLQEDEDGGYSLQIKIVQFDRDNGQFFCSLLDRQSGEQFQSTPARIMVVVPPNAPTITMQPTQAVKENEFVTIHCESTGGNPAPKFSWIFNNNTVVPSSWYQNKIEPAPRATSISILQWRVSSQDNGAYLTCQIWNEAMQKDELSTVETTRLNVLFAPRVKAGPVSDYKVEEGEPVDLVCEAEGNPAPTKFEWIHVPTGEVMDGMHWKFVASRKKSGDYRCTAQNAIDTGSAKINLDVQYGPEITLPQVVNPAEGDNFELECAVAANPAARQITWNGPNGFTHMGSRLLIENIQRTHTGNYSCEAENTLSLHSTRGAAVPRSGAATTMVDVKRKPGPGVITTSTRYITVGDSFTLTCSTEDMGSPPAKFKWATPRTRNEYSQHLTFNRQTLSVDQAQLSDNGLYFCTPYNDIGDGEMAKLKIEVVEPAQITHPINQNKILTAGDIDSSIDCEASGYPQPIIHWIKDGIVVNDAGNPHWNIEKTSSQTSCDNGEYCPWTVVSSLKFSGKVQWSDKGNYTCTADNKSKTGSSKTWSVVSVIHEPHILNEKYPTEALAAADVGQTAVISCLISARPEPAVTWVRDGETIIPSTKHSVQTSKLFNKVDEYESLLEINDVEETDMGAYRCQAANGKGNVGDLTVQLQHKSVPQIPKHIQLYESAPTWITVAWRAGYDGGDHQYFEVEYRVANPLPDNYEKSLPTIFVLDDKNATRVNIFDSTSNDMSQMELFVHNLTLLTPMTMYWYRIRSRNAFGYSEWAPISSAMTLDVNEDPSMQPPTSLIYHSNDQKIVFEPTREFNDTCVLLYVGKQASIQEPASSMWRSVGCFPTDQAIQNVETAEHYKARFCNRYDLSACSSSVDIFVAGNTSSQWAVTIVAPIIIIVVLALLTFVFILSCCCRMRMPHRREDVKRSINKVIGCAERQETTVTMPDRKNQSVMGSNNDSGVFTNASQHNNNHVSPTSNTPDNNVEHWHHSSDEQINAINDEYVDDCNNKFVDPQQYVPQNGYQPYFDGYMSTQEPQLHIISSSDEQTDGSSDTASCSASGTRRVMREIIV